MKLLKGYNKIQSRNKIFGLEFLDLFILIVVYTLVFVFSTNLLINLAIVLATYFFLTFYKKGKPAHWTTTLLRYFMRRKVYPVRRERKEDVFNK